MEEWRENVAEKTMQLKIRESKPDKKRKQGQITANVENVELLKEQETFCILLCIYMPIIITQSIQGQLLGEENKM